MMSKSYCFYKNTILAIFDDTANTTFESYWFAALKIVNDVDDRLVYEPIGPLIRDGRVEGGR